MKRFALIGAAGFIAPRHMKAIKETGNILVAALDKHDNVGILDSHFPKCDFFTEFERFDRHLEKLHRKGEAVHYVSICSPNYLHDSHMRFALRQRADAICEKPLVLNPWNLDALEEIELETGKRVNTILQLRLHPSIIALKEQVSSSSGGRKKVDLTYITSRGNWYHISWKGELAKSGGIATNIGIHFFDMLTWVFGAPRHVELRSMNDATASGFLELEKADVTWKLSIDANELPAAAKAAGKTTFRSLTMEGTEIEFSDGFTNLHTRSYEEILAGRGFGLKDARPSIELAHTIRNLKV
ncbi:MAG: Gfo/Idh/MocA family oxidoreductase [Cyclobacteriaceae bacterium]|nr:Gfo/Idh/MocA family oxidoreductase [Cyclobacteriaceae bacterium]